MASSRVALRSLLPRVSSDEAGIPGGLTVKPIPPLAVSNTPLSRRNWFHVMPYKALFSRPFCGMCAEATEARRLSLGGGVGVEEGERVLILL